MSITGVVTDVNGEPLEGIEYGTGQWWMGTQRTGPDGVYLLENQFPGYDVTITFTDPAGLLAATSITAVPLETEAVVVDVVMVAATPDVFGRVTGPDGNGVAGIRVGTNDPFGLPPSTTNAGGYYGLTGLGAGTQTLKADTWPSAPQFRSQTIDIEVVPGTPTEVNFTLAPYPRVELTITAGGVPAEGVSVQLWRDLLFDNPAGSGRTDSEGKTSINVHDDGVYYLEIQSNGIEYAGEFYPDTVNRELATRFDIAGEQVVQVSVALEEAASISGQVFLPDGSPGNSWDVGASPAGFPDGFQDFPTPCGLASESDPPGTFRVGCLHPSADWVLKGYGVGVADNEYYENSQSAANATPIAVDPGQDVAGLVIQLDPKTPDPTFTGMSKLYFVTGTTTPGVHVYGTNFPSDPAALQIKTDFWFSGINVTVTVTSIVSSNEAIATVTVDPGVVGPEPQPRYFLGLTRSIGGSADCTCTMYYGDPSTQVGTITGKVTDDKNKPVPFATVQVRWADPFYQGGYGVRTLSAGPDGKWTADGLPPRTYQVVLPGTEKLAGEWWNDKHNTANATDIPLAAGQTKTNVNAKLEARGAIAVTKATPRFQTPQLDFDLVGTGLSPIAGGFRVFVDVNGYLNQMQVSGVSDTKLHVSGSVFANGTFDVVLQWTGSDGTIKERRCVDCVSAYNPLAVYPPWDPNLPRGTTTDLFFEGSGLADITKVQVSGTRVSVQSYSVNEWGFLTVTLNAKPNAAVGARTLTITRKDGATTSTIIQVI